MSSRISHQIFTALGSFRFQHKSAVFLFLFTLLPAMPSNAGPVDDSPNRFDSVAISEQSKARGVSAKLDPNNFRCILIGDSQTTTPDPERIRTQFHRWDVPFVGDQIVVGSASSGYLVNNISIANLAYGTVDLNLGWNDGGPEDFFAPSASQWICSGDVQSSGSRFGRYRIGFDPGNVNAPYSNSWGIGVDLVARIAVRTGPMSVPAVMTRAERGNQVDVSGQLVHIIDQVDGIQIIEQPIPASIDPFADRVGVGLHLPSGFIEQPGQRLQVLGVTITVAQAGGGTPNGFMMSFQGRGGWNVLDHLTRTSILSRRALVRMTDATHVMIMLGHNREPEGSSIFAARLDALVSEWESAFLAEGYSRPVFVFVVPWALEGASAAEYLGQVNSDMEERADLNRRDVFVSYYDLFGGDTPETYDQVRYMLDGAHVHPGNIPTAVNLAEDLYDLLFSY